MPPYTEGDLYEDTDHVFIFECDGQRYAYTLLSQTDKNYSAGDIFDNITRIEGIHIWKYDGKVAAVSITDPLPDTTGLKFKTRDHGNIMQGRTEMNYNLVAYNKLAFTNLTSIANSIAKGRISDTDIQKYDYNLDGELTIEDLSWAIKYFTSKPKNFFWRHEDDAFGIFLDSLSYMPDNLVMHATQFVEPVVAYTYAVPTGLLDPNFEGFSPGHVVQILPVDCYDEVKDLRLSPFYSDGNIEDADYIASFPNGLNLTGDYAFIDLDSEESNWIFRAGVYAYALDDDGKYLRDRIP